jgi:hypothetical protein
MALGRIIKTALLLCLCPFLYAQILQGVMGGDTVVPPGTVATPTASPDTGYIYVSFGATVTLSDVTSGATICYRTDGTAPAATVAGTCDAGSTTYSTGISVSTTTTVKALGTKAGSLNSSVASFIYTLSSLVAEWQMANGSGTTSTDSCCGNNLTITAGGGSWGTLAGVSGGIYNFDGVTATGTRMDAANQTYTNFNYNQPFSIFAVLDTTDIGGNPQQTVVSTEVSAANLLGYELMLNYTSSTNVSPLFILSASYPSPSKAIIADTSTNTVVAGSLYDVLVTYSGSGVGSGVTFYVNGAVKTTNTIVDTLASSTTTNSQNPRVGMRIDGTFPFKGKLGPVYLWKRVLTSGEASALHSNFYAPPN